MGFQQKSDLSAQRTNAPRRTLCLLAILLAAAFLCSFSFGRYGVPAIEVIRILLSRVFPLAHTWTPEMEAVVLRIRLPRIVMSCFVGCSLSAAGAAYQGVFQNPMASPDILGASSGAAFGAALAILLGLSAHSVTLLAFCFSLAAVWIVFLIAEHAPGIPAVSLILAGIMAGSLCSACTSFIKLVADPSNQLPAITYWLMGSLSGAKLSDFSLFLPPVLTGLAVLFLVRWRINLLTLGDGEARTLGVNTRLLRLAVIVSSTLVTAASISVSGMIGWVGLVVPHLSRRLVGSDYRFLMPASMLCGAIFLLAVDGVSRNLLAVEIPIGILTAFIGAPFFLYLLIRREGTP